jgi:hypothetical protein
MALIDNAIAQALLDKAAYERKYGALAITGGTDYYDILTASDDPSVELVIGPAAQAQDQRNAAQDLVANRHAGLLNALLSHLQKAPDTGETKAVYSSIGAWLAAAAFRVHVMISEIHNEAFATLGYLPAAVVYDDVKELGRFTVSGAGAGAWSASGFAEIDTDHTGGNQLEAVCETDCTSMSLTLTLTKPDETTEEKTITVAGDAGDVVAIGSASDLYIGVAGVAINSGGAAQDKVLVRTKLDRALAL